MTADIHTCSYYCERPGCIRAQRDELAARLEALTSAPQPVSAGDEIMVSTPNGVFILTLQPSGLDGEAPRFVVHVPLVEAPAVKELQAEIEALRADVAEWKRVAAAQAELHDEAEARANKLDKILRAYQAAVNRIDDLIEYSLPMPPETKAALYAVLTDLTDTLAKEITND